uniref:ATPase AAA-type core domain-containing protein n=1 Tax=Chlorobium chlorochromatii (strain CaD3) TaxID=340177 RepID=Q3AR88_CHLCH
MNTKEENLSNIDTRMKLKLIELNGFKAVDGQSGQNIPLGDITILLGANGSGKSNVVSFFKMLNFLTTSALQNYVGKQGVSQLLFYGPKVTDSMSFILHFSSENATDTYEVTLSHGLPDRLFISSEKVTFKKNGSEQPQEYYLESGGTEAGLGKDKRKTSKVVYTLLSGIRAYHFHDTSDTAPIKDRRYVDDAKYLRHDAGNLAAFLKMLKEHDEYMRYYHRIVRHIQRVMPQFGDFSLDSLPGNDKYVRLNWTDSYGRDYLFGPDQISDGSLRFMALTTLLLQPPELLPKFIVLDEPELGLHPAAIVELAGMIRMVAQKTQILVATQSTRFIDEFSPDDLVIVERDNANRCSIFKKLNAEQLQEWLKSYSLSELWEKNVLGGQP